MIVGKAGPVFPLRAVLREMGYEATTAEHVPSEASGLGVGGASDVEDVWRALDGVTLALALAGYECRQVVIGKAQGGRAVAGYLTLDPELPGATFQEGDWSAPTGVAVAAGWSSAVLVRAVPRRAYGEPSKYAAVSLTTVDGFVAFKESVTVDPFVSDLDGWIVMTSSAAGEGPLDYLSVEAEAMRWQVVDALATAWERGGGGATGLLPTLNARNWEASHDVTLPITQFRQVGIDIWAYLQRPGVMREFLEFPSDDPAATLSGAVFIGSIGLHAASDSLASLHGAMVELKDRQLTLQPRNASLTKLLPQLRRLHWLAVLLVAQEYGLVRTLPFPLTTEVGIPYCDLTGWYETESGVTPVRCLQLNQAADQFDGWWQDAQLKRWAVERAPELADESGPFGTNPGFVGYKLMFTLLEESQPSADATIDGVPIKDDPGTDVFLDVTFEGATHRLARRDRYARLAAETRLRDAAPEARSVGEAMIARLHPDTESALKTAIGVLLSEIQRIAGTGTSDWNLQIVTLEERFRESLEANGIYSYSGIEIEETPMLWRLRTAVRVTLPRTPIGGLDAWKQLLEIMAVAESVTTNAEGMNAVSILRALLAMPAGQHKYTYQFAGAGGVAEIKLIAGGSGGAMIVGGPIAHDRDCPLKGLDEEPNWDWVYVGRLLQAGVSLAGGAMGKVDVVEVNITSNDLFAATEWRPDHFGRVFPSAVGCVFIQGTVSVGAGAVDSVGIAYGYELVEGYTFLSRKDGSVASGTGTGHFATVGVGAGAEVAGSFDAAIGVVDFRVAGKGDPPREVAVPTTPLVAVAEGLGDAGFEVESHVISARGRKLLAHEIARNRALFECPGSVMLVEGDASPTGDVDFNEQLSWRRAKSVYAWIRSALTSTRERTPAQELAGFPAQACALAIAEGRVRMYGHGLMRAQFSGVAVGVEAEEWRMAKVTVNNSELLLL